MIGTLDVKINAAHPNLPLTPFYTFVSSPSSVRVTNVPKKIGSWEITKVFVTANYPDNTSRSAECVNVAGCYVATLPLCNVVGESVNGFQITANGVDENGNAVTGYVLGHGDLIVLTRAGNITVGTTTWYFNFKDAQPTAPVKGDACIINGSLKWYNGTAWVDFGGFNLSDITLDLNADQATINEKLGEVIRRAGGTVIGCLVAILALSGMAAHEYPTNPDPSHKEFFGKMTRDSLVVTNAPEVVESDPVFTAWKGTNTYVKVEADPSVIAEGKNLATLTNTVATVVRSRCPAIVSWYVFGSFSSRCPGSFVRWDADRDTPQWVWEETDEVTDYPFATGVTDPNATYIDIGHAPEVVDYYAFPVALYAVRAYPGTMSAFGFADFTNTFTKVESLKILEKTGDDITTNVLKSVKTTSDAAYVKLTPTTAQKNQYVDAPSAYQVATIGARNKKVTGNPKSELSPDALRFYRGSAQCGFVFYNDPDGLFFLWQYNDGTSRSFEFPKKPAGDYVFATTNDIPPAVSDAHIGSIATNVVRAANGGLWDANLGVWWTPVMSNGKLTYQATTNVNLNAGN